MFSFFQYLGSSNSGSALSYKSLHDTVLTNCGSVDTEEFSNSPAPSLFPLGDGEYRVIVPPRLRYCSTVSRCCMLFYYDRLMQYVESNFIFKLHRVIITISERKVKFFIRLGLVWALQAAAWYGFCNWGFGMGIAGGFGKVWECGKTITAPPDLYYI